MLRLGVGYMNNVIWTTTFRDPKPTTNNGVVLNGLGSFLHPPVFTDDSTHLFLTDRVLVVTTTSVLFNGLGVSSYFCKFDSSLTTLAKYVDHVSDSTSLGRYGIKCVKKSQ